MIEKARTLVPGKPVTAVIVSEKMTFEAVSIGCEIDLRRALDAYASGQRHSGMMGPIAAAIPRLLWPAAASAAKLRLDTAISTRLARTERVIPSRS